MFLPVKVCVCVFYKFSLHFYLFQSTIYQNLSIEQISIVIAKKMCKYSFHFAKLVTNSCHVCYICTAIQNDECS